jgi:hypothetical protein
MKVCCSCKQEKPLSEYHKQDTKLGTYKKACKSCRILEAKKHYHENLEYYAVKGKQWRVKNPKQAWAIRAKNSARARALDKGIEFSLTREYIMNLCDDKCPVFNTPFIYNGNKIQNSQSPSIDRIDITKGYIEGNVVIISMKANAIKNAYKADDIAKVAKWLKGVENGKRLSKRKHI